MTIRGGRLVRVEDLMGRRVREPSGRVVGRIEEICVEQRGDCLEVTEYHLGTGALLERLGVVRHLLGREAVTVIARWDQIDIRRANRPTLTCRREELKHVRR
jgi:hypothetical protein